MNKFQFSRSIFTIVLFGFMANSHAIDNYEPATNTLKIPHVLIGTTTYNNVVLELRDFSLLEIDPDPLTGVVKNDILMQFVSAVQQGEQLKVVINITSQGQDRSINVGNDARVTDNLGNIYDSETINIRNFTGNGTLRFQFDADIPSTVVITYNNVTPDAESIGLLDLDLGNGNYRIGNIPIEKFDSNNPF